MDIATTSTATHKQPRIYKQPILRGNPVGRPFKHKKIPLRMFQTGKIPYKERMKLYKQRSPMREFPIPLSNFYDEAVVVKKFEELRFNPLFKFLLQHHFIRLPPKRNSIFFKYLLAIFRNEIKDIDGESEYFLDRMRITGERRKQAKEKFELMISELKNMMDHIPAKNGYSWWYFGYFKPEDLQKRAKLRQEIKDTTLSPHTFEKYSLPFELEDYAHYLRSFNNHRRPSWIKWILPSYVFPKIPEPVIPEDFIDYNLDAEQDEIDGAYLAIVGPTNPHRFVIDIFGNDTVEYSTSKIREVKGDLSSDRNLTVGERDFAISIGFNVNLDSQATSSSHTSKPSQSFATITQSNIKNQKAKLNKKTLWLNWSFHKGPTWKYGRIIDVFRKLRNQPGDKRPTRDEVHWFSHHKGNKKVPLFTKSKYDFRHMYRHYFGTIRFLDWQTICRNKLVTLDTLRTIVKHDFELKDIEMMSFDQICSTVISLVENEVKKYDTMLKSIYMQSRRVIDQPGGLSHIRQTHTKQWRNQLIRNRKKNFEQGPKRIVDTRREILNICQIPTTADRGILIDLIWSMELRQYLPMGINKSTNEVLCQVLQRYYSAITEKPFLPPETEALLEEEITSPLNLLSSIESSDLSSIESSDFGSSIESIGSPPPTIKHPTTIKYLITIKYPSGTAPQASIKKIKT